MRTLHIFILQISLTKHFLAVGIYVFLQHCEYIQCGHSWGVVTRGHQFLLLIM